MVDTLETCLVHETNPAETLFIALNNREGKKNKRRGAFGDIFASRCCLFNSEERGWGWLKLYF